MEVRILNADGKEVGKKIVLEDWERRDVPRVLLHQVAIGERTNRRVSRAHTKDRAERRGGGRKPWRQKGTGRARHGSIRSPLWRKGGVTFGPRANRTYAVRIPTSMKRTALAGVLAGKAREQELFLLEKLPTLTGKTKDLQRALARLPLRGITLVLVPGPTATREPFLRASRNLQHVRVANPATVAVYDLLQCTTVLTTSEGMDILSERL